MDIEPLRPHPVSRPPVQRRGSETIQSTSTLNLKPESSHATGFHRGSSSRRPRWAALAWSGFANAVDLLIAFALTCLFTGLVIWISGVSKTQASNFLVHHFRVEFLFCVFFVFSVYLLTLRVFAGCSLGEWACGIRLGEPRHRIADDYSLRVIQRFLLVLGTGIVTLPILTLLTGEDQAGRLSGLPLVMRSLR